MTTESFSLPNRPRTSSTESPEKKPGTEDAPWIESAIEDDPMLRQLFSRLDSAIRTLEDRNCKAIREVREQLEKSIKDFVLKKRNVEQVSLARHHCAPGLGHCTRSPSNRYQFTSTLLFDGTTELKASDVPAPISPPAPLANSTKPSHAEALTLGSDFYNKLVSQINTDEWLVVDPALPPVVVTPSSSTVQPDITVKIPLPSANRSKAESIVLSTTAAPSDNTQAQEQELEASSEENSEISSSDEEEEDEEVVEEEEEESEDFDPSLARLEIALLRAKLKLAKLELSRFDKQTSVPSPRTVPIVPGASKDGRILVGEKAQVKSTVAGHEYSYLETIE